MNLSKESSVTVARSCGSILGKRITYKLVKSLEKSPIYRIEIDFDGERIHRDVARDIKEAAFLYDMVVRNLVTPCTLDDVLEDNIPYMIKNLRKNGKSSLLFCDFDV